MKLGMKIVVDAEQDTTIYEYYRDGVHIATQDDAGIKFLVGGYVDYQMSAIITIWERFTQLNSWSDFEFEV